MLSSEITKLHDKNTNNFEHIGSLSASDLLGIIHVRNWRDSMVPQDFSVLW